MHRQRKHIKPAAISVFILSKVFKYTSFEPFSLPAMQLRAMKRAIPRHPAPIPKEAARFIQGFMES